MPGKPYHSCLIPYKGEIESLRQQKPPVSYAQIAVLLKERHGLNIQRAAIAKFVKVRSGGRKVYFFRKDIEKIRTSSAKKPGISIAPSPDSNDKLKFEFQYSERYNLKRLPPEEAAAIRKELEAKGH